MIKYIKNPGSSLIKFNDQTFETNILSNACTNIDWIWIFDEDGIFDNTPVKTGDICIRLYSLDKDDSNAKEYIIIKNSELNDYYRRYEEARKMYRESILEPQSCCEKAN